MSQGSGTLRRTIVTFEPDTGTLMMSGMDQILQMHEWLWRVTRGVPDEFDVVVLEPNLASWSETLESP